MGLILLRNPGLRGFSSTRLKSSEFGRVPNGRRRKHVIVMLCCHSYAADSDSDYRRRSRCSSSPVVCPITFCQRLFQEGFLLSFAVMGGTSLLAL
ncbi:hypothetical protein BDZ94DRAFT_117098 [Collybia nuda]|uniref:Uncharacterized protein n=1 Tax=Collybia nuda TaxID=64659 RepID=A0A9P5XX20_9AGAR|nr:hypothetical protein BDZ94DRAFT_117098 [Collybia nuda]